MLPHPECFSNYFVHIAIYSLQPAGICLSILQIVMLQMYVREVKKPFSAIQHWPPKTGKGAAPTKF